MNPYIGSDFDDFLAEDGIQEDVTAAALKRVLAYQLEQAMIKHGVSQTEMARRMKTSRTTVRRLLDAEDTSVTLATLTRASMALGERLQLTLHPL
ncbi:MAG: XRE family transcriptional regulator [Gammaproteobacteria bacterium]|nr:XRE family transcriptional regulator [Gammaproteobacteria bacterium]